MSMLLALLILPLLLIGWIYFEVESPAAAALGTWLMLTSLF